MVLKPVSFTEGLPAGPRPEPLVPPMLPLPLLSEMPQTVVLSSAYVCDCTPMCLHTYVLAHMGDEPKTAASQLIPMELHRD